MFYFIFAKFSRGSIVRFSPRRRQLLRYLLAAPALSIPMRGFAQSSESRVRVTLAGQALMKYPVCQAPYDGLLDVIAELRRGDVIFTNLEVPIKTSASGAPTRHTKFFHSGSETTLECLHEMGFNLLSLSNNHAWDLGTPGIVATRDAVDLSGFAYAGTGNNIAQASTAGYLETPVKTALIAMAMGKIRDGAAATGTRPGVNEVVLGADLQPNPEDLNRNLAAIRAARVNAEIVIVYLHNHEWGEDMSITKPWAREFARQCIDAGADIFVSHGAPLLHGIELQHNKPILHGLGSLVFHSHTDIGYYVPEVWETAIVHVDLLAGQVRHLEIVPVVINEVGDDLALQWPTRGRPRLANNEQAHRILTRMQKKSAELGVNFHIENGRGLLDLG
jgi:poly-gamma-glutamate capsule biosynthesis protein CapA/YwtB (metallophosphatase superfamily)